MAHFAQLDENNKVLQVIVVGNSDILDEGGNESEQIGIQFCKNLLGQDTNWKQCSYNSNFRKNYPGIAYYYDETRDAFIQPKPFESWVLNEDTCQWEAPTPRPTGMDLWVWEEETLQWKLFAAYQPQSS
jgi:hypothetical protein